MAILVAAAMLVVGEGRALAAAPPAGAKGQAGASAQPTAADLSAQAIERFGAKDYDAAVRLFEEAHKLDPVPNYLFNIGRVYEEKGDIRAAVDYYQRFVKEPGVELAARELALSRLKVLKAILAETEEKKPDEDAPKPEEPPPTKVEPSPAKAEPPPDNTRKMRLAGFALLGVGGAAMATGGVLGGLALSKENQLAENHDYAMRVDLAKSGTSLALGTDVLLGLGGALLLTGVILVGVSVAKKRRADVARVWPAGLGLAGRF